MRETPQARLKRLQMRSMRRGIKEMDLILGAYARDRLAAMSEAELTLYDALLGENDHDLLGWVIGQAETPPEFLALISDISAHARSR